MEDFDVSFYKENKVFELQKHTAVKDIKYYPGVDQPYPNLSFTASFTKKEASVER